MEKTRETLRTFVAETSGRPWIAYSAVIACLLTLCLVVKNKKFDSWAFGLVVLGSAPWFELPFRRDAKSEGLVGSCSSPER